MKLAASSVIIFLAVVCAFLVAMVFDDKRELRRLRKTEAALFDSIHTNITVHKLLMRGDVNSSIRVIEDSVRISKSYKGELNLKGGKWGDLFTYLNREFK